MKDDPCLGCSLPICNDKDARCAFVQIERKPYSAKYNKRTNYASQSAYQIENKTWLKRDRREYFKERYARLRELAAEGSR